MYVLHNRHSTPFALDAPLEVILEQEIAQNAQNALQSSVCIVPTGRRVRLLERTITREVFKRTQKPVSGVQIFTLEKFVKRLGDLLLGKRLPHLMSDALRAAIMEEASERCRKDLHFFTSGGSKYQSISPAVLERLQSIILGLKEDGILPQSLRADLTATGLGPASSVTDPRRLADIATLYESYERTLGDTLTDYPKLLTIVTDALTKENGALRTESSIEAVWKSILPEVSTIILDGFTEFKKPEERFLAALYYAPFHSRIILDYSDTNGPLFGGLDGTVQNLLGYTGEKVREKDGKPDEISLVPRFIPYSTDNDTNDRYKERREEHLPKASYLRRWLFNTEEDIRHAGFNDIVRVVAFENRADEVRSIAKLLRHFALNEQIPLAEMCVVMRQPEQYSSLFREMFAMYAIPANITDRFPLEKSPVVTAVFAVLDMLLYGYKREDVNRALQSPYLRFERKERGGKSQKRFAPLNAANLFTVAGRLRIKGGTRFGRAGKDQWLRRMDSRLAYLSKREVMLNRDANADRDELAETRRFIEEIELAKRDFAALLGLFPDNTQEFTPREFEEFIKDAILAKLSVHGQIIEFHEHARELASELKQSDSEQPTQGASSQMSEFLRLEEEVEKDARALQEFLKILTELTAVLQRRDNGITITNTQSQPGRKRSLEEYIERLRTAVRNGRYQVREKPGYGVTVTSVEQIRSVPFRLTIACGAIDGEFPGRYVPESFLGKELADSEERFLQRERIQFYQALTNSAPMLESDQKRIFITYPSRSDSGDDLTRSSFVDALLKITSLQEAGLIYNAFEERIKSTFAVNQPVQSSEQSSEQSSKNFSVKQPETWLQNTLFGLASEEEAVRLAAVKYVEMAQESASALSSAHSQAIAKTEREEMMHRFAEAIQKPTTKQALMRVKEYLAILLEREKNSARDIRVEGEELAKQAYSISALEKYAKCPYQFFAAKSLGLREIHEYDTSLSPLESGSLLHRILFRFYQEIQNEQRASGTSPLTVKPLRTGLPDLVAVELVQSERERYRGLLRNIAEEELKLIRFDHPFFDLDRDAILGEEQGKASPIAAGERTSAEPYEYRRRGKLDVWLDHELKRTEGNAESGQAAWLFAPGLFEFAFGQVKSELGNVRLAENLQLLGKIDRIEILPGENPEEPYQILIGDYKSGASTASNTDIKNGISLQMPLYSAAAEQILRECYGLEAKSAGAVYYILSPKTAEAGSEAVTHSFVMTPQSSHLAPLTKSSSGRAKEPPAAQFVEDEAALRGIIESSIEKASVYAERISSGDFPVKPSTKAGFVPCQHCDFKPVCRISEMQKE